MFPDEMSVIFVESDSIIVILVILFVLLLQKTCNTLQKCNPYLTSDYVSYFYDEANTQVLGTHMEMPEIISIITNLLITCTVFVAMCLIAKA